MIKIVHVYKGNGKNLRNSVIDAQIDSIKDDSMEIIKFPLKTSGALSYFWEFFRLRKYVKENDVNLIHAHYSYSAIISALTAKKTICSLMGSDVFDDYLIIKFIVKIFYRFVWADTIVKSKQMLQIFPNAKLIPNGVDFKAFNYIEKDNAIKKTKLDKDKYNIIFVAENIYGKVKNYKLAKQVLSLLPKKFMLHPVTGKNQDELVYYYNSADLLLLTSLSEGSPNVIKEAMACNCPIVATDVGDIKSVIKDTDNCYVCDFNSINISKKILQIVKNRKKTNGRQNISNFDSKIVAQKLCKLYYIHS